MKSMQVMSFLPRDACA